MLFATAIHFISLPVCAKSVGQTTYQTEEDELFSSLVDPEECYSAGKALGDVGVFPSRSYKGNGIKIGVIDRAYDKLNEPIAKCVTYKGINHRGNY